VFARSKRKGGGDDDVCHSIIIPPYIYITGSDIANVCIGEDGERERERERKRIGTGWISSKIVTDR